LTALAIAAAAAVTVAALHAGSSPAVSTAAASRKLPIYCTDRPEKVVSLTFDAAWGDEDTGTLIDILGKYGVSATFFVVGEWVDRCPDAAKALAAAGHEIMNHSNTHPHMPELSKDQMIAELTACNDKIEAVTGVRPLLHRPPYGDYSDTLIDAVESLGMYTIQWDVDSLDWKEIPADEIVSRVTSRVQSGSIVLFHNAALHTPEALPAIIEALQAQGYTFLKVSDMIYRDGYTINHEGRQIKIEN
ncbi:MAG: polysaccharide deacetylase family protein, partial [Clostridia bacterium]|nr:polysaccharide deacetylase family protein [Clostridia bacterium]